jgi:hypothetical protein
MKKDIKKKRGRHMKVQKTNFKNALEIVKRVSTDSKKGMAIFQSKGDGMLYIKGEMKEQNFCSFHAVEIEGEEPFCFATNPHQLFKWISGKHEVIEEEQEGKKKPKKIEYMSIKINTKSIRAETGKEKGETLKITPVEEVDISFHLDGLTPLNNSKTFITILKDAERVMKRNKEMHTSYLKLTNEKALAVEEQQFQLYRLQEAFPFQGTFLYKDIVAALSKSLKGEVLFGVENQTVLFANKGHLYKWNRKSDVPFPSFRAMEKKENGYEIRIHAEKVNELMKSYTTKCKRLLITVEENTLTFDPRDENFPIQSVSAEWIKGEIKKAVFDTQTIKNLFAGYEEEVTVKEKKYRNIYGKEGYLWEIYKEEKITMVAGISEPNWEEIEQNYRKGVFGGVTKQKEEQKKEA